MRETLFCATREEMVERLFPKDGFIVEVGVQRGRFAQEIWRYCRPRAMFLVDPWRYITGEYERDPANRSTDQREEEMAECAERVGFRPNVAMMRMLSQEAVSLFSPGSLDAVYIDADHTYGAMTRDLDSWWGLIRSGGVLAGHDWVDGRDWIEVKRAVREFVAVQSSIVRCDAEILTTGERDWASWAVRKL